MLVDVSKKKIAESSSFKKISPMLFSLMFSQQLTHFPITLDTCRKQCFVVVVVVVVVVVAVVMPDILDSCGKQ